MNGHERLAYLADPAVWAEPHTDLEGRIVDAIAAEVTPEGSADKHGKRILFALVGVAAAALIGGGALVAVEAGGPATHPVRFTAALAGTALSPHASGDVTLTQTKSGWRIRLHATGLARRDHGQYYEAWLKDGSGVLVPIGTFNEPEDVTLWAGVAPSAYPTLSVTLQEANGTQVSSGQVVLVGTTHRT